MASPSRFQESCLKDPKDRGPNLTLLSSCKLDHKYRIQDNGEKFLIVHPKPSSLVVTSLSKSKHSHSVPIDKESKTKQKKDGFIW